MKRHDRRPGCAKNRGSRHQDYGRERCSQLNSCGTCIEGEPSLNISCEWVTCGTSENSSCVSKKEYEHESCTVTNSSSMCTASAPENRSSEPEEVSPEDSPESKTESPPVFHTGSFIGGGILVILLQAVGYLVLKQLRGPERDYQTMEETPQ
ncbi:CD164 sialomucin-like 2 protein isoform X3 [Rhinoderma darwinii]|uniref:CD164 sialomucin-like 2 protein isoform X3 n=1 Tax=Rhinoderma darwinii TaxID=43563 RepID=UPI003F66D9E1